MCEMLGDAYFYLKRYEKAGMVYKHADNSTDRKPELILKMSKCEEKLQNYSEASKLL
jgi:hypothetical protein